jgi:tRNA threonylcarbamoyladenosine biosynthesis protein TsaE
MGKRQEQLVFYTESSEQTIWVGEQIGAILTKGDVIALSGDLGSGKTWLTKGIALGLGVDKRNVITSPSFTLVNEYKGRCPLYHMDVYRLGSLLEFIDAGLEEYFFCEGVVVMEWADRWPEILPAQTLHARLAIIDELRRRIAIFGLHPRASEIIFALRGKIQRG